MGSHNPNHYDVKKKYKERNKRESIKEKPSRRPPPEDDNIDLRKVVKHGIVESER